MPTGLNSCRRAPAPDAFIVDKLCPLVAKGTSDYAFVRLAVAADGQTWDVLNANRPVEDVGDYQQRVPSIAVGADDIIHLVWYGNDAGNRGKNQRQIKYVRSADGGATWSHWRNIGEVPGYHGQELWQEHPTISTAGSSVYVVWEGADETYKRQQIKYALSTDNGLTWTADSA